MKKKKRIEMRENIRIEIEKNEGELRIEKIERGDDIGKIIEKMMNEERRVIIKKGRNRREIEKRLKKLDIGIEEVYEKKS